MRYIITSENVDRVKLVVIANYDAFSYAYPTF